MTTRHPASKVKSVSAITATAASLASVKAQIAALRAKQKDGSLQCLRKGPTTLLGKSECGGRPVAAQRNGSQDENCWSAEQLRALRYARVIVEPPPGGGAPGVEYWAAIAHHVPGKSAEHCARAWTDVLDTLVGLCSKPAPSLL